ncbi:membrane-associated sensor domain-containing protein [Salmonella enterica]|nr:Uncharacterised protein [Salmonella enterica subsp. enterica serovar Dublin]
MGQDSDDRRRTSSAGRIWQDHKDMVTQALRVSIPWFTFVNISFALIILFRHILISDFDKSISAQTGILPLIDDIMGSIIVFSFLILLFIYRLPARFTPLCLVMLLILSLMWSYCSYFFIVWWQLPFAWPLSVILMLNRAGCALLSSASVAIFHRPVMADRPAGQCAA